MIISKTGLSYLGQVRTIVRAQEGLVTPWKSTGLPPPRAGQSRSLLGRAYHIVKCHQCICWVSGTSHVQACFVKSKEEAFLFLGKLDCFPSEI